MCGAHADGTESGRSTLTQRFPRRAITRAAGVSMPPPLWAQAGGPSGRTLPLTVGHIGRPWTRGGREPAASQGPGDPPEAR